MDYPKVELHCHMDGAIPDDLFLSFTKEDNLIPFGTNDNDWIMMNKLTTTMSLSDCMKEFELLTKILQTPERLTLLAKNLLIKMYDEGTKLIELRFSPQSHLRNGLDMEEVILAVLKGRELAIKERNDMLCGFILCMMNLGQNLGSKENNLKTIELATKYLDKGIIGIDLAGDETATPIESYKEEFIYVKELNIPFTIHAGESGSYHNVDFALDIGAKRIGHGIHAIESMKTVERIIADDVLLEISPTSNYLSRCVNDIKNHPIRKLFDKGVKMNINTDDPGLMNINLKHEYDLLKDLFHFTDKELVLCNLNSAKASFIPGKERIIQELEEIYNRMI